MEMKYIKVFTDFAKSLEPLSDAECGRLFIAMLEYAEQGIEPEFRGNERFLWPTAKLQLDRSIDEYQKQCKKNAENGSKGGRPKKPSGFSENPKNPVGFTKTQKSQDEDKEEDEDKEDKRKENRTGVKAAAPQKQTYGEFGKVKLSDEEHGKLVQRLGKDKTDDYIERLDGWLAEGNQKKNHYATILNWYRKDEKKPAPQAFTNSSFDLECIEEMLKGDKIYD